MRAWFEREWQRAGGGALVFLPLALLYRLVTAVRAALYRAGILRAWKPAVPVIVVGNVTAGGTGKTPLVVAIVAQLLADGRRPGVISRGYGRVPPTDQDPRGVVRVLPGVATPEHFGDEPVLIARRTGVPVYVSPDRPAAARELLAAHPEVDVIVADDGLQHYALGRDVEIAVVDGERAFGNGLPLPSGPLREPVSRLATVDAVVVNGGWATGREPAAMGRLARRPPEFTMVLGGERFVGFGGETLDPAEFAARTRGRAVALVAGIGHPPRFFSHLARLAVFGERLAFPDHHHYQAGELRLPGTEFVVMTEKDAVKCLGFADSRFWFLQVDAGLPPSFADFLRSRLATRH